MKPVRTLRLLAPALLLAWTLGLGGCVENPSSTSKPAPESSGGDAASSSESHFGHPSGARKVVVNKHEDRGHEMEVIPKWIDESREFLSSQKYDVGGTLVVGMPSDADSLMPLAATSVTSSQIYYLLFLKLTNTNPDFSHGPLLADRWEFSDDRLELTFYLNPNIYWHDGVPTTAHDVQFTFERQRDEKVAWSAIKWKRFITKCEVIDDHTVKFTFEKVYPYQLMDAGVGVILPKHLLGDVPPEELKNHPFGRNPVGNGPFKFKSWKEQQQIEIVANEKYHLGRPPLDRIIYRVIPDQDVLAHELTNGSIDFVQSMPPRYIPRLGRKDHLVGHVVDSRAYTYIGWNLKNELFQSQNVRKALTMAINRQEIIDSQLRGYGEICKGPISPILAAANPNLPLVPYDPVKAREMLEAEGWKDSDGDGILDRDGKKFSFVLKTNKGNKIRENIVVQVQDMLKDVGIEAKPNILEWTTLLQDLTGKDFEATVMGWSVALKMDMTTTWHTKSIPDKFNFVSYSNPEFDAINDEAVLESDSRKAIELWWKAQEIIVRDQPYTFLYVPKDIHWVHRRFQNVQMQTIGWYANINEWWVKKSDRKY